MSGWVWGSEKGEGCREGDRITSPEGCSSEADFWCHTAWALHMQPLARPFFVFDLTYYTTTVLTFVSLSVWLTLGLVNPSSMGEVVVVWTVFEKRT